MAELTDDVSKDARVGTVVEGTAERGEWAAIKHVGLRSALDRHAFTSLKLKR